MFTPLHVHSDHSLLDGISKPKQIIKRCLENGFSACALTDHGTISGIPDFFKEATKAGIKPILGNEFYLCNGNATDRSPNNSRPYSHLCVLARNLDGWKSLIQATSRSASKQYSYYNPRLNLEDFRDFANGNLIAFSGHCGSAISNVLFHSPRDAYACLDYETVKTKHIKPNVKEELIKLAQQYQSVFGKENFFLEKNQMGIIDTMPAMKAVGIAIDWLSNTLGIPVLAACDAHYPTRSDAFLQRTLLCSKLRTTHNQIQKRILNEEDVELAGFFKSDHLHIPTTEEMLEYHKLEELEMAYNLSKEIESYQIRSLPKFPKFDCPDGMSDTQYLRKLSEDGYDKLIRGKFDNEDEYRERLEMELGVIDEAGITSYFLIVQDIIRFVKEQGWTSGVGRGSASGCLLSYLIDVTQVNPIPYNLLFSRFYGHFRNTVVRDKDGNIDIALSNISLPDVDLDVGTHAKQPVFNYLKKKFGEDKVARISTFNKMMGRSILDEVLAAHDIDFTTRKAITQNIPDKSKIAEELQELGDDAKILEYMLEEQPKDIEKWVRKRDDGTLEGEFSTYYQIAVALEGTIKNASTHAAGVVVASEPISNFCPVVYNKDNELQTAVDMNGAEFLGAVKLDILTVCLLSKGETIRNLCLTGECDA